MSGLIKLFAGEMKRMVSYKILPVSLATSLICVVIFALLSASESQRFAPLLLYMDAGVMSLLLAGAFHHLERTDGTAKTMMVLPVSTGQVILSKALAAAALGLISALVVSLALYFLHGIALRYLVLALVICAAAMAHAALGLAIALKSRDFSGTLGGVMLFIIILFVPALLLEMSVIPRAYAWLAISRARGRPFSSRRIIRLSPGWMLSPTLMMSPAYLRRFSCRFMVPSCFRGFRPRLFFKEYTCFCASAQHLWAGRRRKKGRARRQPGAHNVAGRAWQGRR